MVANPTMIAAYKSGIPGNGKPFPDGSEDSSAQSGLIARVGVFSVRRRFEYLPRATNVPRLVGAAARSSWRFLPRATANHQRPAPDRRSVGRPIRGRLPIESGALPAVL